MLVPKRVYALLTNNGTCFSVFGERSRWARWTVLIAATLSGSVALHADKPKLLAAATVQISSAVAGTGTPSGDPCVSGKRA